MAVGVRKRDYADKKYEMQVGEESKSLVREVMRANVSGSVRDSHGLVAEEVDTMVAGCRSKQEVGGSANIIMVQPGNVKSKVRGLEKEQKVGMMKEKVEPESAKVIQKCQTKFLKPYI